MMIRILSISLIALTLSLSANASYVMAPMAVAVSADNAAKGVSTIGDGDEGGSDSGGGTNIVGAM